MPTRLSACSNPQSDLCIYPCGVAMRCYDGGWDYDFTVDAGPPCP